MEQKHTTHKAPLPCPGTVKPIPISCGEEMQDMMERARLEEAKHRNHRRERCTLPSDGLTEEELQALNGPVRSWNLNEPMTPAIFRTMPEDLQDLYLTRLQERIFGKERNH